MQIDKKKKKKKKEEEAEKEENIMAKGISYSRQRWLTHGLIF
jgi:hypothetical protein